MLFRDHHIIAATSVPVVDFNKTSFVEDLHLASSIMEVYIFVLNVRKDFQVV